MCGRAVREGHSPGAPRRVRPMFPPLALAPGSLACCPRPGALWPVAPGPGPVPHGGYHLCGQLSTQPPDKVASLTDTVSGYQKSHGQTVDSYLANAWADTLHDIQRIYH